MSADTAALYKAVRDALKAAAATSDVTLYEGAVSNEPPTEAKGARVLPYWVMWASPGRPADERAVTEVAAVGLRWEQVITVASGHQAWTLGAVQLARDTLAALVLPGGARLVEEREGLRTVQRDTDVTPTRYFLPVTWTALLP